MGLLSKKGTCASIDRALWEICTLVLCILPVTSTQQTLSSIISILLAHFHPSSRYIHVQWNFPYPGKVRDLLDLPGSLGSWGCLTSLIQAAWSCLVSLAAWDQGIPKSLINLVIIAVILCYAYYFATQLVEGVCC